MLEISILFKKIVQYCNFEPIFLKENFSNTTELIINDKKHLDNNPISIQKTDIFELLKIINT